MNKTKIGRIVVDLVLIILGIIFLVFGIKDLVKQIEASKTPDNVLFSKSYTNVETDNAFKYNSNVKTGMVFIASKNDPLAQVLAPVLNNIAKENNIVIYYTEDKDSNLMIVFKKDNNTLKEFKKDDLYELNYDGIPIDYWNDTRINNLKNLLQDYIETVK